MCIVIAVGMTKVLTDPDSSDPCVSVVVANPAWGPFRFLSSTTFLQTTMLCFSREHYICINRKELQLDKTIQWNLQIKEMLGQGVLRGVLYLECRVSFIRGFTVYSLFFHGSFYGFYHNLTALVLNSPST